MTQTNKLEVKAVKGVQESFIIREFNFPRALVFKAFADPHIFAQFWGPDDSPLKLDYYDFKKGGSYRYRNFDHQGNELCAFSGVFHEITEPERIIQTSEFEGLPEPGHVVLEAILFEALPGDKTKLIIHDVFRSVEDRDAMINSGVETGLEQGFNRLEKLMALH